MENKNILFLADYIGQSVTIIISVHDLDTFFHALPDDEVIANVFTSDERVGGPIVLYKKELGNLRLYK